jgi:NAD(P)-dependent dehydrogenase (short-subunit alcohol dehydrogenase family)
VIETGLAGKRALVAGGASGIGRAIAHALGEEGASVAIADRRVDQSSGLAEIKVELGDEQASVDAVDAAVGLLGGLDLLVYTAAQARHEPATDLTPGAWAVTFGSNLAGCVWTCREAARRMIGQGGGSILVVGSTSVCTPAPRETAYRASKAALKAYAEVLALELAPFQIRVNILTPGAFRTPPRQAWPRHSATR